MSEQSQSIDCELMSKELSFEGEEVGTDQREQGRNGRGSALGPCPIEHLSI
jgi:hypothetical protein